MKNAMVFGSFLGGSFESFFSLLTMYQLDSQSSHKYTLQLVNQGTPDFQYRDLKNDPISTLLMDKYSFPLDLDDSFVISSQNRYYLVGTYENVIHTLQRIELQKNPNLDQVLIFLTEPFDEKKKNQNAMMNVIRSLVPKTFHQNIVTLNNLTLPEFKELNQNIINSNEEGKNLIKVTAPQNPYLLFFADALTDDAAKFFKETTHQRIYLKSNPSKTPILINFIQSLGNDIQHEKNFDIQDDLMSLFDLCSLASNPECEGVAISTKEGLYVMS